MSDPGDDNVLDDTIYDGQPDHHGIHSDTNAQLNYVTDKVKGIRQVINTGRLSAGELATSIGAAVAQQSRQLRILPSGHSMFVNDKGEGGHFYGLGITTWANIHLCHALARVGTPGSYALATSGFRIEQMIAAGYHTQAAASDADIVFAELFSNNVVANDASTFMQAQAAIWLAPILAAGKVVFLSTIPHRNDIDATANPLQIPRLYEMNRWIRNLARTTPGVYVVDANQALMSAVTGKLDTGLTYDGIHPNAAGASKWGKVLADAIRASGILGANNITPNLPTSPLDPFTLSPNPRLTGNESGEPTNVDVTSLGTPTSVTKTKVTRPDGVEVWRIAVVADDPTVDGISIQVNSGNTKFDGGDKVRAVALATIEPGSDCRVFQLDVATIFDFGGKNDGFLLAEDRTSSTRGLTLPARAVLESPSHEVPATDGSGEVDFVQQTMTVYGSITFELELFSPVIVPG